jgi:hypothetical protein
VSESSPTIVPVSVPSPTIMPVTVPSPTIMPVPEPSPTIVPVPEPSPVQTHKYDWSPDLVQAFCTVCSSTQKPSDMSLDEWSKMVITLMKHLN